MTETVEQLLRGMEPRDRDIVALGLQGHDVAAIADQVHCTRRTVQRVLKRVKERLQHAV